MLVVGVIHTANQLSSRRQIAVLVITALRPRGLNSLVGQLVRGRSSAKEFPVIISQDGDNSEVAVVASKFVASQEGVLLIQHEIREEEVADFVTEREKAHARTSLHYKWALDKVFLEMGYELVIAIEDDLDIAEDFFSYFAATQHLLYADPSIWCITAWNYNGAAGDLDHSERLHRTDGFPSGYGWMIRRELWIEELSATWPRYGWDIWLNWPEVRQSRVCIRPEVGRSHHNMTAAQPRMNPGLFESYFASTYLPNKTVDFASIDMRPLEKQNYDANLVEALRVAEEVSMGKLLSPKWRLIEKRGASYRVEYASARDIAKMGAKFRLWGDTLLGVPRTAYCGVVTFTTPGKSIVYAVHPNAQLGREADGQFGSGLSSQVYDPSWDEEARLSEYLWNKDAEKVA